MIDFCDLHFLAPVESKAGAGALEAEIGHWAGVKFDGLLKARQAQWKKPPLYWSGLS
jgi:hypothetical protein